MVALDNSPASETYLRLQARKSFALGLYVTDHHGRPLDLAGTCIRMVVRKTNFSASVEDDSANLIVNSEAELVAAGAGFARFHLQAADLDQKPGEYEYSVTLLDNGYSSVLLKGILDLVQNTEYNSTEAVYAENQVDSALQILLKGQHVVKVRTGPTLAPGTTSFTDSDKAKLDDVEQGAQVNVKADWNAGEADAAQILNKPEHRLLPSGGAVNSILVKRSKAEGDSMWVKQFDDEVAGLFPSNLLYPGTKVYPSLNNGSGRGGLDATGIVAGMAPVANGNDSWNWENVVAGVSSVNGQGGDVALTADDIPDGVEKVQMTMAERARVAIDLLWTNIGGKPLFGTAAFLDDTEVLKPLGVKGEDVTSGTIAAARLPRMGGMLGQSHGTLPPTGGSDNDYYFQYET